MFQEDEIKTQLDALKEEHRVLDEEIEHLMASQIFDHIRVQRMKIRKLRLKDNISRLESLLLPDIIA